VDGSLIFVLFFLELALEENCLVVCFEARTQGQDQDGKFLQEEVD
jgi:hypothetical protein